MRPALFDYDGAKVVHISELCKFFYNFFLLFRCLLFAIDYKNCQSRVVRKQIMSPYTTGRSVAIVVHFLLPVSL